MGIAAAIFVVATGTEFPCGKTVPLPMAAGWMVVAGEDGTVATSPASGLDLRTGWAVARIVVAIFAVAVETGFP